MADQNAKKKEKCFHDAVKAYEDAAGRDLHVKKDVVWRKNTMAGNDKWVTSTNHYSAKQAIKKGKADQYRLPDVTIGTKSDEMTVLDLKFTRPGGDVDDWHQHAGQSGRLQKDDYNSINEQNNPAFHALNTDPKLDPEKCQCSTRGSGSITQQDAIDMKAGAPRASGP